MTSHHYLAVLANKRRDSIRQEADHTRELAKAAIAAVHAGENKTTVAQWCGIPRSTLDRWIDFYGGEQ